MRRLFWVVVFVAVAGCGRKTDFLFLLKEGPPRAVDVVHKLKELQGETKVDILWVIDNSGSMGSYQTELVKNADLFINGFVTKGGLEWKMGIISTSTGNGPYVGFTPPTPLYYKMPDAVDVFKASVGRLGTAGDIIEQTFASLKSALDRHPDFLRPRATLALIMLTDAQEQSRMPAANILKYLLGLKGDIKRIVAYGVFAALDFGCPFTDGQWNYKGSPYETVITETKGKVYKLCNTDFGNNLADLGKDLTQRIQHPYIVLNDRPLVSTLRVGYQGKDLPGGALKDGGFWYYDFELNRITFHNLDFAPGDNEEVSISFQVADEIPR